MVASNPISVPSVLHSRIEKNLGITTNGAYIYIKLGATQWDWPGIKAQQNLLFFHPPYEQMLYTKVAFLAALFAITVAHPLESTTSAPQFTAPVPQPTTHTSGRSMYEVRGMCPQGGIVSVIYLL